jgi:hypothetical protein
VIDRNVAERIIPVKNLDGSYGRLNVADCKTVKIYCEIAYYKDCYLHNTKNNRWYLEEFNPTKRTGKCEEIDFFSALNLLEAQGDLGDPKYSFILYLEDVSETEISDRVNVVVPHCLKCREIERRIDPSKKDKRGQILKVLRKAKTPLSGREISERSGLKYDSAFRTTLSRLVETGIAIKASRRCGYVIR